MLYGAHTDGLVQGCMISIVNGLEILQFYTKPSILLLQNAYGTS